MRSDSHDFILMIQKNVYLWLKRMKSGFIVFNHKLITFMNKKESLRQANKKKEVTSHAETSRNLLLTSCAFHPTERITNFCTSKQCFLPLCPKCVKIHTDQHIKMGIFGEFNTIEESFLQADEGIRSAIIRLGEFQRLIIDIRRQYDQKIAAQKKSIRDAKNHFIDEIQRIIDEYEKAMTAYESKQNKQFLDDLYISQELLGNLSENCEKAIRRLSSSQTVMQGIINFYSDTQEVAKVEMLSSNLQKNFPEALTITFYPSDLQRLETMMKRYLDAGRSNEEIWNMHKSLYHKEAVPSKQYEKSQRDHRKQSSPLQAKKQQVSMRRKQQVTKQKNISNRLQQLNTLESNLNLARFKSPLDNFSLTRLRNQNRQLK